MAARDKPTTSPHLWVSSTYFAEGYPYTVVNNIAEILFKELGASLQVVGLTALFHLPWNLKFLWGPLIDQYETKRRWLIGIEVALSLTLVVLSFFVSVGAAFGVLAATFLVMAFLSATHDIAIDGYYLEGLDERGQSKFVGFRAMSFRVAAMILSGPGLIFIGWAGWNLGFVAITLVMIGLSVGHWFLLPRIETRQRPIGQLLVALVRWPALVVGGVIAALVMVERKVGVLAALAPAWHRLVDALPAVAQIPSGGWIALGLMCALLLLLALRRRLGRARSAYARAFVSFLEQPKVGRVLAFVVLFRAGESFLMKMKWPFLKDVVNMPLDHYGFANGTVGLVASFSATMLGGWLISRDGLRRWIWPFMIAQNVLNLLYVGLAFSWFGPSPGLAVLTAVITFERLGEGLGTAVFMVYLMRCCDPEHKAAHMAIVTALMSVAFTIAGVASGFMADALGFGRYFVFTFIATLPAMGLIFLVPHLDGRQSAIAPT